LARRVSKASPAGRYSRSSRPMQRRHAGPAVSIINRSPVPPHRWHIHSAFGWTTTSSGARLAFSAKRSRFFSESFGDTQCVRYDASIAGFPLRLKRSVWRRGVRPTYAVGLASNPLAVAQDRNSRRASEMRCRLARTTSSRQSICPRRQRSTARGSSHPIPTRMSMPLTKCRAASAASAALATRSASGTRLFRLICGRTRCSQRCKAKVIRPAPTHAPNPAGAASRAVRSWPGSWWRPACGGCRAFPS
jgi:hypothetical protein